LVDESVSHDFNHAIKFINCETYFTGPFTKSLYSDTGTTLSCRLHTTVMSLFRVTDVTTCGMSFAIRNKYMSKDSSAAVTMNPCGTVLSAFTLSAISACDKADNLSLAVKDSSTSSSLLDSSARLLEDVAFVVEC